MLFGRTGESAKSREITKAKKAVRSILETVFWHVPQYKTEYFLLVMLPTVCPSDLKPGGMPECRAFSEIKNIGLL